MMKRTIKEIDVECFRLSFYSYSTYALFQKRASDLKIKMSILTYIGIFCPLFIGLTYTTYGVSSIFTSIAVPICVAVGFLQLLVSLWGSIRNWYDQFASACDSFTSNLELYEEYDKLLRSNSKEQSEAELRLQILEARSKSQTSIDAKLLPTAKENRYGQRAALMHFQKACKVCKCIPTSMKATSCSSCGKF